MRAVVSSQGSGPRRRVLAEEDWQRHVTTLEGWREFTNAVTTAPDLLPEVQWAAQTETDRFFYDEYRLDY